MFGLDKSYVAVATRIAAVMVTRQTSAVNDFGLGQRLYGGPPGGPDANPCDNAFLRQRSEQFPDGRS
jgi:hypothetical protein